LKCIVIRNLSGQDGMETEKYWRVNIPTLIPLLLPAERSGVLAGAGPCPASPAERGLAGEAGFCPLCSPGCAVRRRERWFPARGKARPSVPPHRVQSGDVRSFRLARPSNPRGRRQREERPCEPLTAR